MGMDSKKQRSPIGPLGYIWKNKCCSQWRRQLSYLEDFPRHTHTRLSAYGYGIWGPDKIGSWGCSPPCGDLGSTASGIRETHKYKTHRRHTEGQVTLPIT